MRSHASSRTTTLPMRRASPGFICRSRISLLRLFKNPIVATRCAIGVPNCAPSLVAVPSASSPRISAPSATILFAAFAVCPSAPASAPSAAASTSSSFALSQAAVPNSVTPNTMVRARNLVKCCLKLPSSDGEEVTLKISLPATRLHNRRWRPHVLRRAPALR